MNRCMERRREKRERSSEMIRQHYFVRGWQGAYQRYEVLLSRLIQPGDRVLDVGCGRQFPMASILKECGAQVYGLDPVYDGLALDGDVSVRKGSVEQIPYPEETFDVVTSRSVFEHLRQPVIAFKEFRRVLTSKGRVIFLTPSKFDYVSLAARLIPNVMHGAIMKRLEGRDEADVFPTYYRMNSACRIRHAARRTGFVVERLDYVNHYPYLLKFSPALCRVAIAYDEFICSRQSLHWLQAWILGVLRKERQDGSPADVRPLGAEQ